MKVEYARVLSVPNRTCPEVKKGIRHAGSMRSGRAVDFSNQRGQQHLAFLRNLDIHLATLHERRPAPASTAGAGLGVRIPILTRQAGGRDEVARQSLRSMLSPARLI